MYFIKGKICEVSQRSYKRLILVNSPIKIKLSPFTPPLIFNKLKPPNSSKISKTLELYIFIPNPMPYPSPHIMNKYCVIVLQFKNGLQLL